MTNRVKRVRRWRRRPLDVQHRDAPKVYRADRSLPGGTVQICVSAPESFADALEVAAKERRVSRSHLIRIAVERLLSEGK